LRPWLLLVLFAALFARAVTPAGWMPDPRGDLAAPFVICTGDGSHTVQLDRSGQPAQPGTGERHDLCAFAGHHAAPVSEAELALGSARVEHLPAPPALVTTAPATAPRHREQAQRAPPVQA